MAAGARWGDLRRRALSAAVLAPVAMLCVWLGGAAWTLLLGVMAAGLLFEWLSLGRGGAGPPRGVLLVAGVAYIAVAVLALWWLRSGAAGRADLVFVVLVVWASDIGAYVVGRMLGGPKLAPAISPGKTWSGAIGGLLIAMAVGVAAGAALSPGSPGRAALAAAVVGVASALGDLLESWAKRRYGVKDSGWLIPGHGGLLDRLDGLLAAAPAAALVAMTTGRGAALWN